MGAVGETWAGRVLSQKDIFQHEKYDRLIKIVQQHILDMLTFKHVATPVPVSCGKKTMLIRRMGINCVCMYPRNRIRSDFNSDMLLAGWFPLSPFVVKNKTMLIRLRGINCV